MAMVYVTIEGRIVQSVSTDDPAIVGIEYTIIDYDTEGAAPDELGAVKQPDGQTIPAFTNGGGIIDRWACEVVS